MALQTIVVECFNLFMLNMNNGKLQKANTVNEMSKYITIFCGSLSLSH